MVCAQMINELIREYLDFNRYRDTLSVMMPETGQPSVPVFSREFLARRLHIIESNETRRVTRPACTWRISCCATRPRLSPCCCLDPTRK